MKNRLLIAGACLPVLMVWWGLWNFHSRDSLPRIKSAEQLRNDCVLLSRQFPLNELKTNKLTSFYARVYPKVLGQIHVRDIPEENWPASIQQLKPLRVTRDEYAVCIWIKKNERITDRRNWVAKGYYVHVSSNAPPRPPTDGFAEYFLYETKYEGIDEFDQPALVL